LWVIFALLDPDSESGSGSTDPIESGSATLWRQVAAAVERRKEIRWRRLEKARRIGALFECGCCFDAECPLYEVILRQSKVRIRVGHRVIYFPVSVFGL
jgi:hypothetical protein